jgi:hypothetical protein
MLGAILVGYAAEQVNSEATPMGLFRSLVILGVGFVIFMSAFRNRASE